MNVEEQTRGGPEELRLELPAAHSAARMASHLVREFGSSIGLEGNELETLLMIASELLSNAVDHGGGGSAMEEEDLEEPIRMLLEIDRTPEGWEMRVSDQGGGDPGEVAPLLDQSELPDLEDERGRGFFLLSSMLESLRVDTSSDGRGLRFTARRTVTGSG